MNETIIRWTDSSWNPVSGCSKVSDGCRFCYAMTISLKFKQTSKPWTIQNEAENVVIKPHKLHEPYTLGTEPQRCFVNSMSDLFHRVIPDWYRAAVFCVMLDLPHIIFQTLTKRSDATIDWHERFLAAVRSDEFKAFAATVKHKKVQAALAKAETYTTPWGANIWQGVSVEDARVLSRIDDLRQCHAAVRFISAEPLLGAWGNTVDLSGIHWIIVGGESGKHINEHPERYMKQEWAREIKNLCVDQGVAYFYKQDSGHTTELRPCLTEADGSRWEWMQYPDAKALPVRLSADGQRDEINADGKDADYCLRQAQHFEREAYTAPDNPIDAYWRDIAAMYAAYWYEAAARLRPAPPINPNAPSGWLLGGREVNQVEWNAYEQAAGWNVPLTITDPIPPAPITKVEPDYADPFDLPANAKVISLWQPWASLMLIGAKQVETRSWSTPHRGTLVIHASKKWDKENAPFAQLEPFMLNYVNNDSRPRGVDEPMQTVGTRNTPPLVVPPFLVNYYTREDAQSGIDQPMGTLTTEKRHALVIPPYIHSFHESGEHVALNDPLRTITAEGGSQHALITPPMITSVNYFDDITRPVDQPMPTQTTANKTALVIPPFLAVMKNSWSPDGSYIMPPRELDEPLTTIVGSAQHHALVTPFIATYNSSAVYAEVTNAMPTISTVDRNALIECDATAFDPADLINSCGFRMLEPEELKLGMSFPKEYVITGNKREQVRQVGNAVACNVAEWIVERCVESLA